ncbi:hypothetical protein J1N10_02495 [Carboxylicivirga sp. A043]|uniref:hypothetical protein n=1 Tax=Carboxylicivirga litoralis TaxID=2816963 RepID=UPI0021CB1809|nr:hypothetical protein [Carboxylicivirga sp. A043]MCU4154827.1 hypothetical protein [Carboxylicivirga sp. A043]
MRLLRLLLLSGILLISLLIKAENGTAVSDSIEAWDNSKVDYRTPSADTIAYYRALPEYQYDLAKEPESVFSKILRWLASYLTVSEGGASALGWFLIIAAVIALLFLIIKLAGIPIKGLFVFSRSTKVSQLNFGQQNTDIEEQNLDNMLKVFINNKAYREATRVLFLQALRSMHRKGFIQWNAFKTDRQYYFELKEEHLKTSFLDIIRNYEFMWYGKFEITETEFTRLKEGFNQFINELEKRKAS